MPTEDKPLSLSLSLSWKVSLGNYESAEVFVSVQNVTAETTEDEISELLDGPGKITYLEVKKLALARGKKLLDGRNE